MLFVLLFFTLKYAYGAAYRFFIGFDYCRLQQ